MSLISSVSGCVFLPDLTSLRMGIHTVCALLVWERSTLGQLSSIDCLPALCSPFNADALLSESALWGGHSRQCSPRFGSRFCWDRAWRSQLPGDAWRHLIASGLSTKVVETILQSRAPSTRKSYAAKWQLFTSWCHSHQLNPVECPIGSVLEFLQDRFASGLSSSTLNVYMAVTAAHHSPVGD